MSAIANQIPGVDTETAEKIGLATDLVVGIASGLLSSSGNVAASTSNKVVDWS
jgi:hypothetical protein